MHDVVELYQELKSKLSYLLAWHRSDREQRIELQRTTSPFPALTTIRSTFGVSRV